MRILLNHNRLLKYYTNAAQYFKRAKFAWYTFISQWFILMEI